MKRWIAALAPWMVVVAAHGQSPQAVNVDYTYQGIFKDDAVRIDQDVYAAPVLLRKWGWTVNTRYQDADVQITDRFFRVKMITANGRPMVNLSETARSLGARTSFSPDGKTYNIRSWVRNIEATKTGIRVDGTLDMRPRLFKLNNPDRLVIDLEGAEYDANLITQLPPGWRAGQVNDKSTRIVIEHPTMVQQPMPKVKEHRTVEVPLLSINPNQQIAGSTTNATANGGSPQPLPVIASISPVQKVNETPKDMQFALPIRAGKPGAPIAEYITPTTLRISIPASLPDTPLNVTATDSSLLRGYTMTGDGKSTTMVTIETTKPMAFDISPGQDNISVKLFLPNMSNGTLAGKVIVIDPGHGGKDPGTQFAGVSEKDITLKVGNLLAQGLVDTGASVIRTRSDDRFISLDERSETANRNRAALFISIHVNSNSVNNTASGTITFYHNKESQAMLLAACVHQQIVSLKRLPDKKTLSDTKIYKSGFAVLRNSEMPGVLIELGFVNHSTDRAVLTTASFQSDVAKAIVRGIKVYYGMESAK